jgi:hypothetical protein
VNPGAVAKNRALGYVADEVFDPCGHRLHDADFVEVAQRFGKVLPPEVRDYEMTDAEMPGVITEGRQLANLDRSLEQFAMLRAGAGWNPDARDALTWMRCDDVSRYLLPWARPRGRRWIAPRLARALRLSRRSLPAGV